MKVWWNFKTLLNGYRQLHCSCENRWYLQNIAEDVERRFDTSNFEVDRPLPKGKNKTIIELMKDELGGQIMKELRAKHIAI